MIFASKITPSGSTRQWLHSGATIISLLVQLGALCGFFMVEATVSDLLLDRGTNSLIPRDVVRGQALVAAAPSTVFLIFTRPKILSALQVIAVALLVSVVVDLTTPEGITCMLCASLVAVVYLREVPRPTSAMFVLPGPRWIIASDGIILVPDRPFCQPQRQTS